VAKPDGPTQRFAARNLRMSGPARRSPEVPAPNTLTPADIEYLLMLSPAKRVEALVSGAIDAARCLDMFCGEACEPREIEKVILEAVRMRMALLDEDCPPQRM
jgi:hypothetical protein